MPPEAGTVAVHLTAFARESAELARLERFLAPDELHRAGRLLDPRARNRFIAGRGFLRETLAGYLGEEPARLRLAAGEFGKPCLAEEEQGAGVCFNLSHAGDYCLLAVAVNRAVGIDLEQVRDDLPFREMARRYFSVRERAELFSLPEDLPAGRLLPLLDPQGSLSERVRLRFFPAVRQLRRLPAPRCPARAPPAPDRAQRAGQVEDHRYPRSGRLLCGPGRRR